MQLRESLINLSITVALVCVVAVLALVLKGQRPAVAVPVRPRVAVAVPVVQPVAQPTADSLTRPRSEVLLRFDDAKLIDHPDNQADSFRLRVGNDEARFCLYYVSGYTTAADRPDSLQIQANRVVKVKPTVVTEIQREAYRFTMDLLTKHKWKLCTHWDRHSDGQRYFCLIEVEVEKGKPVYLADLLVRQGYARITGMTCEVPGQTQAQYLAQLKKSSSFAQSKKLGLWSKISG